MRGSRTGKIAVTAAVLIWAGGIIIAPQVGAPRGQRGRPQQKIFRPELKARRQLKSFDSARTTWVRTFTRDGMLTETGLGVLYGYRMAPANDGGLFLLGHTSEDIPAVYDSCLLKIDASGAIVWQKVLRIPSLTQFLRTIFPTTDGGCIAGGEGGAGVLAMKFDANGDIAWKRSFIRTGTRDGLADLRQTSDGGYVLLASSDNTGGVGEFRDYDIWLIKLDPSGNPVWQRTYGSPLNDRPAGVIETDGGLVICGKTQFLDPQEQSSLVVLRLTASGDIIWQTAYLGWDAAVYSFSAVQDGGLLAAGLIYEDGSSIAADAWAMKITAGGVIEWNKVFHGDHWDGFYSIASAPDTGILACGVTDTYAGLTNESALLVKLSPSGQVVWQKAYGGGDQLTGSAKGRNAIAVADGSLYLAGTTSHGGLGGIKFLLVKASSEGLVERLPGFVRDTALEVIDWPLDWLISALVTLDGPVLTSDPDPTILDVPIRSGVLFAPPVNLSAVTLSSRSLALIERSNVLTWEANPVNIDLEITKYRIRSVGPVYSDAWYIGETSERIDEVDGNTLRFVHSPIRPGGPYAYRVWGIGADGGEGIPAFYLHPDAGKRP